MRSSIQTEILNGVHSFMKPIARFLLRSGIGFREFSNVCKIAFVEVSTSDYGIRGRPTNISRVAVMTGLTRKEVKSMRGKIDAEPEDGLWLGKLNLPTQILHYWHNDPDFCETPGKPKSLPLSGPFPSFSDLVHRYAGDIPPGAMRVELMRAGGVIEEDDGNLFATRRHYIPQELDENLLHSMAFSFTNLAATLDFNASTKEHDGDPDRRRYERYVWISRLSPEDRREFEILAEARSNKLLMELDEWVSNRERQRLDKEKAVDTLKTGEEPQGCGLGIYFFEGTDKSERSA
jgi:hypothetical protein